MTRPVMRWSYLNLPVQANTASRWMLPVPPSRRLFKKALADTFSSDVSARCKGNIHHEECIGTRLPLAIVCVCGFRLSCAWQGDGERTALALGTLHFYVTAMQCHYFLHHCKPNPHSTEMVGFSILRSEKPREELREIRSWNTYSAVLYRDTKLISVLPHGHRRRCRCCAVGECILNEVEQHLVETHCIAKNIQRCLRAVDDNLTVSNRCLYFTHNSAHQGTDIQGRAFNAQLTMLNSGDIEQRTHHVVQPTNLVVNHAE